VAADLQRKYVVEGQAAGRDCRRAATPDAAPGGPLSRIAPGHGRDYPAPGWRQASFDPASSKKELIRVIVQGMNQALDNGKNERGRNAEH
jgi:hypothetical protein